MEKITSILFSEVEDERGNKLGRIYDIRSKGEPECGFPNARRTMDEILCGRPGILEVLGFKKMQPRGIPWSAVKSIEPRKVIVDLSDE
jgi:sporulation protein YlmC with PRC-barrel domain